MARLIQKIYEVNPLTYPKCQGRMRVIAFIEDNEVIKKILKHLCLWEIKQRPPPKETRPPKPPEYRIDYSASQLPGFDNGYISTPSISPRRRLYEPEARDTLCLIFEKNRVQRVSIPRFPPFPIFSASQEYMTRPPNVRPP